MNIAPHLLILAAGQGKRMYSKMPKVLHPVLFHPMIHHVLDLAQSIPHYSVSIVVGHGESEVVARCKQYEGIQFFTQKEQLGTAHAVRTAEKFLSSQQGSVLILSGDVILLRPSTINRLIETHTSEGAACTLMTANFESPKGYGRIIRGKDKRLLAIHEELDCLDSERAITEINCGIYCFEISALLAGLVRITNDNAQKEYYLPDVVARLIAEEKRVSTFSLEDPLEALGINDRQGLWQVQSILQMRSNREFMSRGVTLQDPLSTFIDPDCKIASDVEIEGGCTLIRTNVEPDVKIESSCRLVDSRIGERTTIRQGSYIEGSVIGPSCSIGPYARLRPESRIEDRVKIGNFVEIKKSHVQSGAKASHLSYIGDAEIGKDVNLGCGFITCNYDGRPEKHRTTIEEGVFVGSDCQMVAPVKVGAHSYIASGSTVTSDVPSGSLVLTRGRQVTKEGYAKKYLRKSGE